MEIHFTPEITAKLTHSAAPKGCNPDELVQDVLAQYLDEESRFIEAVKRERMPCRAATISRMSKSASVLNGS